MRVLENPEIQSGFSVATLIVLKYWDLFAYSHRQYVEAETQSLVDSVQVSRNRYASSEWINVYGSSECVDESPDRFAL
jgi:hypothetical protein